MVRIKNFYDWKNSIFEMDYFDAMSKEKNIYDKIIKEIKNDPEIRVYFDKFRREIKKSRIPEANIESEIEKLRSILKKEIKKRFYVLFEMPLVEIGEIPEKYIREYEQNGIKEVFYRLYNHRYNYSVNELGEDRFKFEGIIKPVIYDFSESGVMEGWTDEKWEKIK